VIDKLFFSFFSLIINLVIVQVSLCHAEDINTGAPQTKVQDKLVPGHEIKYEETLSPDWKVNWDLARSLYRDKKYPEALVQYEILFTQKENIDEARWEYVTILMHLRRWDNAKGELEKLLATEPESISYRLAMAKVCMETGNLDGAVALYSQLHGQSISEAEKIPVLKGLVKAYELRGQKAEAAVLLGQLVSLDPEDFALQLKQATLELELDNVIKAKELCNKLELLRPQDVAVLSLQAVLEDRLNSRNSAATYWQKVIGLDPDNAEAHSHLSTYYFDNGNWAMSFNHLEPLIKLTPNDVDLLRRAADLNMRLDRIDRALAYYEYGLAVDPLNKNIVEGKGRAEKILAEDLLALVENEGGNKLWQDVVQVAPDCVGVYREIANLLRDKGKNDALIEVLTLLNKQVPGDPQVSEELASLLEQQGHVNELSDLQTSRFGMDKPESN
jgi:tetratricopeptide (TPR) repeat protein